VTLASVIAYISQAFQKSEIGALNTTLLHINPITHNSINEAITAFTVLASSISTGAPLPPGLGTNIIRDIDSIVSSESDDLDHKLSSHGEALAVVEVAARQISDTVVNMVEVVKTLVGEIAVGV
jgi:hypothetical protein